MKTNSAILFALFGAALVLASCGSEHGSVTAPSRAHDSVPADTSWRLVYQASCVSGHADECRGYYGFSVRNDGTYEVGPGPDHELLTGHLEPAELKSLQRILGELHVADFAIESRGPETCLQAESGPTDRIALSYHDSFHGIVKVSGSHVCFDPIFVPDASQAQAIQLWLSGLVEKYYPAQFPNPCVSAAAELEQEYAGLTGCQQDSDCAYLDINFLPADRAGTPVVVDDCTQIATLPVANAFAAVANQRELLLQRELAKKVCGNQLMKPACGSIVEFDSGSASPVCDQGVCRVNSRVEIR